MLTRYIKISAEQSASQLLVQSSGPVPLRTGAGPEQFHCGVEKPGRSRQPHKLEIAGSNPASAPNFNRGLCVRIAPSSASRGVSGNCLNQPARRRKCRSGDWTKAVARFFPAVSRTSGNSWQWRPGAKDATPLPDYLTTWSTTSGKADGTPNQRPSIDAQSLVFTGASVLVVTFPR